MVGSEYIALSQGTIGITWLLCSSAVTRSEAVGGRWGQSLLNVFGQAGFVVGPSRVKQPRLVCQCLGRSHSHRSHISAAYLRRLKAVAHALDAWRHQRGLSWDQGFGTAAAADSTLVEFLTFAHRMKILL